MADEERKVPKAKVTVDDAAPAAMPAPEPESAAQGATEAFREGVGRVSSWVTRHFPGHENAFVGGVLGLVAAVLIFCIGILRALVICALVLVGVAVGQVVDGDPKIIDAIRKFVTDRTE